MSTVEELPETTSQPEKTESNETSSSHDKLIAAIYHYFKHPEGRIDCRKLWEDGESIRYRVNWWNDQLTLIIMSAFIHVSIDADGKIQIEERK